MIKKKSKLYLDSDHRRPEQIELVAVGNVEHNSCIQYKSDPAQRHAGHRGERDASGNKRRKSKSGDVDDDSDINIDISTQNSEQHWAIGHWAIGH